MRTLQLLGVGLFAAVETDLQRRAVLGVFAVDRDVDLLADDLELLDGRRTLKVGRDEHRFGAFVAQQPRQLAAGRRFAGALQAAHHQDGHLAAP